MHSKSLLLARGNHPIGTLTPFFTGGASPLISLEVFHTVPTVWRQIAIVERTRSSPVSDARTEDEGQNWILCRDERRRCAAD